MSENIPVALGFRVGTVPEEIADGLLAKDYTQVACAECNAPTWVGPRCRATGAPVMCQVCMATVFGGLEAGDKVAVMNMGNPNDSGLTDEQAEHMVENTLSVLKERG